MICNKCGKTLPDDSTFCQFCGRKIEIAPATAEETSTMSKEESLAKVLAAGVVEGHKAVEENRVAQPQNEVDSQFGLVPEKPIYTAGIDEQEKYLQSLRTPTGEPIKWSRRGSMSVNGVHGMIDVYDIYLMSGAEYKTIYINMYGARNSTMAPSGFVLMTPAPKATVVKTPKQKEPKVRRAKKTVNKKLVVCLMVIPIAIVLVALLVVFVLIPGLKYNHAKKLLENGNYELAYSEFLALDGYSDSENMLLECRYVQAIKYRDAGDYELANKIFESLGDYRDSKILIHKHDYKVSNTVAATCTSAGSETYKCTGCGDSYIEAITLTHAYVVSSSEEASCQKEGYKTFRCSYCNDEYTEKLGKTSHKLVVSSTQEATCTKSGSKQYKCSTCGYEYAEEIPQKTHSYSAATCTKPKTCTGCGKTEGTALGHSDSVECLRCGEITFKPLKYSGYGVGNIMNVDLPKGKYNFIITHSGNRNFFLDFNNRSIVIETGNVSYVHQYTSYGLNDGYFNITSADGYWTITIEAVGN